MRWYGSNRGWCYYLESDDGKISDIQDSSAHCLACALAEAISRYGGDCDLRGLHVHGICYQWLAVTVRQSRDEMKSDRKKAA